MNIPEVSSIPEEASNLLAEARAAQTTQAESRVAPTAEVRQAARRASSTPAVRGV